MRKFISMVAVLAAVVATSGCDKTREVFGLKRTQVDEFGVVDRQPLSTPPNYNLRPPLPGVKSLAHKSVDQKAKTAVLGSNSAETSVPVTKGEKVFLEKAKATNLDPNIRVKIAAESAKATKDDPSAFGEDLVFWKNKTSSKGGDVIDPRAENKKYNGQEMPQNK